MYIDERSDVSEFDPGFHLDPAKLKAAVEAHGTIAEVSRLSGIAPSTLRSAWSRAGYPNLPKSMPKMSSPVERAGEVSNEEILSARVRELERLNKDLREGQVMQEAVIRRIEAAIERAEPVRKLPAISSAAGRNDQDAWLNVSDLHAGEVVSLEETQGMNQYDWATMEARMEALYASTMSHVAHFDFPVRRLHLSLLGDNFSGDIHEELAITNDRPVAQAVIDLSLYLRPWISRFLGHFETITVHSVPGNHARYSKKPTAKLAHNNADWLLAKILEIAFEHEPRVTFNVRYGGFNLAWVSNRWRVLLMHGDGIRSTMPGVPWGGISRRIATLEAQFTKSRQPIDYCVMGHWHTQNSLEGIQCRVFINGSVKGLDEYSLKQFGSGRPAAQSLLTFSEKRGWTGLFPIDLQDVVPASEGWH